MRRSKTTEFAYQNDSQHRAPSNTVHLFWDDTTAVNECQPPHTEIHIGCIEQIGLLSGIKAGMVMTL